MILCIKESVFWVGGSGIVEKEVLLTEEVVDTHSRRGITRKSAPEDSRSLVFPVYIRVCTYETNHGANDMNPCTTMSLQRERQRCSSLILSPMSQYAKTREALSLFLRVTPTLLKRTHNTCIRSNHLWTTTTLIYTLKRTFTYTEIYTYIYIYITRTFLCIILVLYITKSHSLVPNVTVFH